jgi:hypothetical protein
MIGALIADFYGQDRDDVKEPADHGHALLTTSR